MFLLHHRRNTITNNQSEWRKNCRTQSATSSTIFKLAATEQELTVAKQEILKARTDEEALAKAVRCCPILYNERMREFKDHKKKENAPLFTYIALCRCVVIHSFSHFEKSEIKVHPEIRSISRSVLLDFQSFTENLFLSVLLLIL